MEGGDPIIGELIDGKYLVEARVARGGTATVYRAKHVQLEIPVALKVMHPHLTVDKIAVERFRREAMAGMQIRHPNAIGVLDFAVTASGVVYVVTEFLSGVTLRDRISEGYEFTVVEANEIMQQVCAAVAVAHKRGIIHRDLKPDNIFLHEDNFQQVVKVLDFGIAKIHEQQRTAKLTRQGFVLGTPHYMSPEQCHGREVDARSDIYSLGVVLYELLTGSVPFQGNSYSAIVVKKMREQPRPVYELRPDIPPLVNAVVMHALSKDPNERPESVQMFARELEIAIRAVTEEEFSRVFRSASERELEAAILLAGEPGRFSSGSTAKVTGTFQSLSEANRAVVSGLPTSSSTGTFALERKTETVVALREQLHKDAERYLELLQLTEDALQLLRQEMCSLSKEIRMLLDVVIGDLEAGKAIDETFFSELKTHIDSLRAVMYHMNRFKRG
ncbi:MAG: serine/threonine-protein kinase [Acidobacteriota bacterium]|nr:serine/threonine-protein kinase [Acidobacteriota bacterium]